VEPHLLLWLLFGVLVLVTLALDLGVFNRESRALTTRQAVRWSVLWISLGLAFALPLGLELGREAALSYLTAYVVEKSLSIDNIFLFLIVFRHFGVPARHQHRVLFWGILSAILFRGVMIGVGVAAIHRFEWLSYLLGAVLIYSGVRLLARGDIAPDPGRNRVVMLLRRFLPLTRRFGHGRFFYRRGRRLWATPLLLVLVAIETTDLVFALDSVPAVLAVTRDPLVAYTSNIFAILGLRALYFALAGILQRLRFLHYGLSLILCLIGLRMLGEGLVHVPTTTVLALVLSVLAVTTFLSLLWPVREAPPAGEHTIE
jgi:tellurite resistance protein TerC